MICLPEVLSSSYYNLSIISVAIQHRSTSGSICAQVQTFSRDYSIKFTLSVFFEIELYGILNCYTFNKAFAMFGKTTDITIYKFLTLFFTKLQSMNFGISAVRHLRLAVNEGNTECVKCSTRKLEIKWSFLLISRSSQVCSGHPTSVCWD